MTDSAATTPEKPPFVTSTALLVMFRLAGQDWRLWSKHIEGKHKDESLAQLAKQYPDAEVGVAREVTTIDWIEDEDA